MLVSSLQLFLNLREHIYLFGQRSRGREALSIHSWVDQLHMI